MRNKNRKVAIIGGARIPFAKSFTHYSRTTNNKLMSGALNGLVKKYGLEGQKLGEVALGTPLRLPEHVYWLTQPRSFMNMVGGDA